MVLQCPVCLSPETEAYPHAPLVVWDQPYSLARCRQCGSAFTANLPDDEILAKFYRTSFDYRWYSDHLPAKIRDSEMRLKEYAPLLGRRVLDFGGGIGYFSEVARKAGYDSITYDPFASGGSPPASGWDTLVALHVIEHANDIDRLCGQIKSLLAPGGRIILAVPNFDGLGYRTLGMDWVWAQPPLMHIFHLTAKGLQTVLARHGFAQFEVSYHERWDANNFCDVEQADETRRRDQNWGRRTINRIPLLRKLVAVRNTAYRFKGLNKALEGYDKSNPAYSELQITAVLAA